MEIRRISSAKELKSFILFPFELYKEDPLWVPPLLQSEFALHDRRRHPFHRHAQVEYFLAYRHGKIAGRIAAIVNHQHNAFHKDKVGFWGFFDCENHVDVARGLLDAASEYLKSHGMDRCRGPMNFSVNETVGLLIDGFDAPPMIMMTHNPPYLPRLVEELGHQKAMDLFAFTVSHETVDVKPFERLKDVLKRDDLRIRPIHKKKLPQECKVINAIYNDAWTENWGFVPMTDAEIDQMAHELKPIFDPRLSFMVEIKDEPVAFAIALPDVNQLIKKINGRLFPFGWLKLLTGLKNIRSIRVLILGVRKKYQRLGLGVVLCLKMIEDAMAAGYTTAEMSWVLETNRLMIAPLERMGARLYKRYRIYEKPI